MDEENAEKNTVKKSMGVLKGAAHVYKRDNINTDEIIPARYLNSDKEEDLALHAMEDIDIEFVNKVKPSDFIVAGKEFGCGSSREHAIWALRGAGVKAVIADSYARIFYRNAINNGFLALECKGISEKSDENDVLEINLIKGVIKNITKDEEYSFVPLSGFAAGLIEAGGLMKCIRSSRMKDISPIGGGEK